MRRAVSVHLLLFTLNEDGTQTFRLHLQSATYHSWNCVLYAHYLCAKTFGSVLAIDRLHVFGTLTTQTPRATQVKFMHRFAQKLADLEGEGFAVASAADSK